MSSSDPQGTDAALRARGARIIVALAALFFLPLALSFWLYYGMAWRPSGHTNHGELIEPARPLPHVPLTVRSVQQKRAASGVVGSLGEPATRTDLFQGHWSLVYIGRGTCDSACRHALYVMRQTRLALNQDMTRVQRVFVATADCCDERWLALEHPGLAVVDAQPAAARPLLAAFPARDLATTVFVVDPLGNLMMSYDSRRNPRGLLDDLKKLLSLSHIG